MAYRLTLGGSLYLSESWLSQQKIIIINELIIVSTLRDVVSLSEVLTGQWRPLMFEEGCLKSTPPSSPAFAAPVPSPRAAAATPSSSCSFTKVPKLCLPQQWY